MKLVGLKRKNSELLVNGEDMVLKLEGRVKDNGKSNKSPLSSTTNRERQFIKSSYFNINLMDQANHTVVCLFS